MIEHTNAKSLGAATKSKDQKKKNTSNKRTEIEEPPYNHDE